MDIGCETLGFSDVMKRLAADYRNYGILPKSKVPDRGAFLGLIYDDSEERISLQWHIYPLMYGVNGKAYNEMFPETRFEVAWSEKEYDDAPVTEPNVFMYFGNVRFFVLDRQDGWAACHN